MVAEMAYLNVVVLVPEGEEPSSTLNKSAFALDKRGQDPEVPSPDTRGILALRAEGALFYANAELFHEQVKNLEMMKCTEGVKVHSVIRDFSYSPSVDSTVVAVLMD